MIMNRIFILSFYLIGLSGCLQKKTQNSDSLAAGAKPADDFYKVDRASAGSITGKINYTGRKPERKAIDMSGDPACVEAHVGKAYDKSLVVNGKEALVNAFVYVKSGLEGKQFEAPAQSVVIEQKGCWFRPRILGIQVGQTIEIINSDPVTHNIHPMGEANHEWNHSQGPGEPSMHRKFQKAEVMIPVKCNIHSWMHAYLGVIDHPYFAVSGEDGSFSIASLPPGTYTLAVWHERLGTQEQRITVDAHENSVANFIFKGK